MLEQAVYAGRNHTVILAVALAALAMLAAAGARRRRRAGRGWAARSSRWSPARTAARGSHQAPQRLRDRPRRAQPAAFRTTAVEDGLNGAATLGPDGQAWFGAFLRGAGARGRDRRRHPSSGRSTISSRRSGPGPDGTLWPAHRRRSPDHARDGPTASRPPPRSRCRRAGSSGPSRTSQRAADGADVARRHRLRRRAPRRARRVAPRGRFGIEESPDALAADAAGGVWFTRATDADRRSHRRRRDDHARAARRDPRHRDRCRRGAGRQRVVRVRALLPGPPGARRLGDVHARADPRAGGSRSIPPAGCGWRARRGSCTTRRRARATTGPRASGSAGRQPRGVAPGHPRHACASRAASPPAAFYAVRAGHHDRVGRDLDQGAAARRHRHLSAARPGAARFERALARGDRPVMSFYVLATDREGNVAVVKSGGRQDPLERRAHDALELVGGGRRGRRCGRRAGSPSAAASSALGWRPRAS